MSFEQLNLSAALLRAIGERNYATPTSIQSAAIPEILRGRDLLACAATGSGKTAAFALPILQRLEHTSPDVPRRLHALVLVPTRELAAQIGDSFNSYARYLERPVKILTVFGGVSINPQMMALRGGADIVVATPGRLLDLVDHNAVRLDSVATLVLDEADRMLDLGFADELGRLLEMLPVGRQTILCSATFPDDVQVLADRLLRDSARVNVPTTPANAPIIEQRSIAVDVAKRSPLLRHLIQQHGWQRVLVFVATKYSAEHVAEKLQRNGIQAAAFHGELSQGARTWALAQFKAQQLQVIVATDVAARGIDIERLPVVVNYDLPRSAVDYLHRIGRTGRAGEAGAAVSFVSASTEGHMRLIEKRNGLRLPRETVPGFEPIESVETALAAATAPNPGGIKGKRKSKKDKLREAAARKQS